MEGISRVRQAVAHEAKSRTKEYRQMRRGLEEWRAGEGYSLGSGTAMERILRVFVEGAEILSLEGLDIGSLPPEIGHLRKLTRLTLTRNRLSKLPPEIGKLTNLVWLHVGNNRLAELPPEIGDLVELGWLVLDHNELSKLPLEMGSLTKLWSLKIEDNKLVELPLEIGALVNLQVLDAGGNELHSLPLSLANIPLLTDLGQQNNGAVAHQKDAILYGTAQLRARQRVDLRQHKDLLEKYSQETRDLGAMLLLVGEAEKFAYIRCMELLDADDNIPFEQAQKVILDNLGRRTASKRVKSSRNSRPALPA